MANKMIDWHVTREDHNLIVEIANRAHAVALQQGVDVDFQTLLMDLTACHTNGCQLKLAELLAASPFDFTHDVFGIVSHINRSTGQLENCFLPRYAV